MPTGGGIALIVVGAILTFAVTGSIRGVDLQIVGVILMLAGAAEFLLPLLVRTRRRSSRPVGRSLQGVIDDGPQPLVEPASHAPSLDDARRTRDLGRAGPALAR